MHQKNFCHPKRCNNFCFMFSLPRHFLFTSSTWSPTILHSRCLRHDLCLQGVHSPGRRQMCISNDKPTVSTYCVPTACDFKNELRCDSGSQGMHSLERRYICIKNNNLLKKKHTFTECLLCASHYIVIHVSYGLYLS